MYDIVYADFPWNYYGSKDKNAAAGKHYSLMSQDEVKSFPMHDYIAKPGALFLWATCPRLNFAIEAIEAWNLHYRGVAYVWVKTRKKDGAIISGQGVPPTGTKPTTELVLLATTNKRGRPFPLLDHAQSQVVLAPRGRHSEKPGIFRDLIVQLYGDRRRIELFARGIPPIGWDGHGDEHMEVF